MLAVAVGGACLVAYLELRTVLLAAARERAASAAQRIAVALDASASAVRRQADRLAGDSVVRAAIAAPFTPGSIDGLRDLFAREHARAAQVVSLTLLTRDGRALISVDSAHGSATTWLAAAGPEGQPRVLARGIRPIEVIDGAARYDVIVPVLDAAGRDTIGFVQLNRQMASASNQVLGHLIGPRATMRVGNLDGSAWTDLVHPLVNPNDSARMATADPGVIRQSATLAFVPWQVVVDVPTDGALVPARRFIVGMLFAGILLVFVGVLAALRITREVTGPLAEIGAAAAALAAGDHSRRARVARGDELGQMADAFNAMAERVEDASREARLHAAELVAANRALRESEARYRHIATNVPGAVYQFIYRPDGSKGFTVVSEGVRELFGVEPADVLRDFMTDYSLVHPDDRESFDTSGADAVATLAPWHWEGRAILPSGKVKWIQAGARQERQPDGSILCDGLLMDLTERRALEDQLRQAQKMEAVGQLAGGIAHDFNNILTAITGFSELLLADTPPGDDRREAIGEIRTGADRAAALTRQLLAFSRRQMLQPRLLDLNRTVRDVEAMLRRLIVEDITLVVALDPRIGMVRADPGQIEQVLVNLVVNARDAMPRGGSLTIETSNVDLTVAERDAEHRVMIPPGSYVRIAVTDTGCGIDDRIRARIFEPFFTTKELGKGTGLGLSTAYGIVKQSGGYIWCRSEPDAGATFNVYLPRVAADARESAATPIAAPRSAPSLAPARETILLVEDDVSVRTVGRRILVQQGYTVLEAENGAEALRICEERTSPIDLIVSDMVMPEMNGPELGRQIRERHPGTLLLFMSGYTRDAALRQSFLEPGTAFIEKPFSPVALARRVREVLDSRPSARQPA
ncbi:MAG: response regulator [Gemmatimonadaceae bacterium]|nr:response regulator [Gemmatimonadaceae bacterium]